MLVELRDVEVYIEPEEILTKALEEGDLSADTVVHECIINDGVEAVLDAIDNEEIAEYCKRLGLIDDLLDFEKIVSSVTELNQIQKAQLIWLILKSEG